MRHRFKQLVDYAFNKEHMTVRTVQFTKLSAFLNAILAIGKIGLGAYSLALFVCVNGLYNVGIALAKHTAVQGDSEHEQRKHYLRIGVIILVASLVYMVYCVDMVIGERGSFSYDLITALAIATFTFTEIGVAVYGMLKSQEIKNLRLQATKRINLVTALISLVLTQSALLGMSGTENAVKYCGWAGLVFGGVSAIIGISMIIRMKLK
jgi:hypothetical protein